MILPRGLFNQVADALHEDDAAIRNKALMALAKAAPLGWSLPQDEESGDDPAT
jgi:hypothetical protein